MRLRSCRATLHVWPAVFAASLLVATRVLAQGSEPAIALAGVPPQTIARFAQGQWHRVVEALRCAARGPERIVASGGAAAFEVTPLATSAGEWKGLESAIAAIFEKRQREHHVGSGNLARVPIQIDAIHAARGTSGPRDYYFEASRRVPDPGTAPEEDPKGTLHVTVSGWLRATDGSFRPLGSKSQIGWDQDRPDGDPVRRPDLVPLAIVRHDSRSIWVMKGSVGDIGWIDVYEVGPSGVGTAVDQIRCLR